MSSETHNVSDTTTQCSGRVKWFNNKAGYGFITCTGPEHENDDVFAHHSAILVAQEQYRYLVQGEYVNFTLCAVDDKDHKWQAGDVKGINNGKLMCETRHESRQTRTTSDIDSSKFRGRPAQRPNETQYRIRSSGQGPREGEEWMLVRRRAPRHASTQEVVKSRANVE